MASEAVSKTDFAKIIGVTPTRVGQYIREGKLAGDALVGEGRFTRIDVDRARAQLRLKLDFAQRLGNGIDTRLDDQPGARPPAQSADAGAAPVENPLEGQIKRERLAALQATNRRAAEEEHARRGLYVRSDHVRAEMTKLAIGMLNVCEGSLPDLAAAVAARFELPQRDLLHILRAEFREVRVKASAEATRRGQALPSLVTDEVADASDPAMGEA